ncbi:hypothetical protein O6H91_07G102600 [Diphasiastrum complanatum]|uniref:Uncharacterized protein n=1 Tax=Diphasiastrum complanatum TaxID=34168 RepID=A0ACC2D8H4_DIPCM|nr:hypothetical protein O6H91_07G102600 [Diphasiastrum complanatum]
MSTSRSMGTWSVSSATTSLGTTALSGLKDKSVSLLLPNKLNRFSNPVHFRGASQASIGSTSFLAHASPLSGIRSAQRLRNRQILVVNVHGASDEPKYDPIWWKRAGPINMREIHSPQEFINARLNACEKLVVVIFYGSWCRSCRVLHPKLCKLAEDYGDVEFLKVNMGENRAMCTELNVKILPFFHFYRGGEDLIDAFSCSLTKLNKLKNAIQSSYNYNRCITGSPVCQKLHLNINLSTDSVIEREVVHLS